MLARHLHPVSYSFILLALDHKGTDTTALCDDVRLCQRFLQFNSFIDVVQNKRSVFWCNVCLRLRNLGISGADNCSFSHRDSKEEPSIISKESQYTLMWSYSLNDQVDSLRKDMLMLGVLGQGFILKVDKRTTSVNQYLCFNLMVIAADLIPNFNSP